MVVVDMEIPRQCTDCPCSHWIQSGEFAGMLMCNVIEQGLIIKKKEGDATAKSLVDEYSSKRPESCPIICEIKDVLTKGERYGE